MFKLGINFDEISDDIDTALEVMSQMGVKFGELRTVQKKNFVFWNDDEIQEFKNKIRSSGIELVAASSPLFKWYVNKSDPEIIHDNFGFNARLSDREKKMVIKRTMEIARELGIVRLRIFSGLGKSNNASEEFATDKLLSYALELASKNNIDLYLENEPVCRIHSKQAILGLLKENNHNNLKLWLDISNLIEVGEDIDEQFLESISSRLGYLHIKDYVVENGNKIYVPAGSGIIDYDGILSSLFKTTPDNLVITVETHAITNKVKSSKESIMGTRKILDTIGVVYE